MRLALGAHSRRGQARLTFATSKLGSQLPPFVTKRVKSLAYIIHVCVYKSFIIHVNRYIIAYIYNC